MTTSPLADRDQLRIVQVRSYVPNGVTFSQNPGEPLTSYLDFGRLQPQVEAGEFLAPNIVAAGETQDVVLKGDHLDQEIQARWQQLRARTLTGDLVDVRFISTPFVSIDLATKLLEDLYYDRFEIDPVFANLTIYEESDRSFLAKPFHLLTYFPDSQPEPSWEAIHKLIYRVELEAIEEQSSIIEPVEINRRPGQYAAVSRFGSVLWNVQDYIEVSAILSAILTVGALERVRSTRITAAQLYHLSLGLPAPFETVFFEEDPLAEIHRLRAGLTHAVGAFAFISPLLQSLRAESFHQALREAAAVEGEVGAVSQMLNSLPTLVT